jgi:hypothetical protein
MSDPSEELFTTKLHENCASIWLNLYMRDNEYVQQPSRSLAVLNPQHLKVLVSMILKDQKNITSLNWSTRQLFTATTQHLTPAVVKYKNLETKWSLGRDVVHFHYPSCTDSIKPSLQFSCNFVVINASEVSLCSQILKGLSTATILPMN